MQKRDKPIVGLAMGDAAGIGPELIIKALKQPKTTENLDAMVIGDAKIMRKAVKLLKSSMTIETCQSCEDANFSAGVINVIDLNNLPTEVYATGKVEAAAGKAAVEYIEKAVQMALDRQVDAIATAPVNKEAMHLAGYDFAGVTELLGRLTDCKKFSLVVVLGPIRLFWVTNHVSLRKALDGVTKEAVLKKIHTVNEALTDFGIDKGSIAVTALNPHGGEGGAMGAEEIKEIIPAINIAQEEGINVLGPFPADTIFLQGRKGKFDAILAMYHDQGNIAAKLMDFGAGVTVVAGLPIIRTSVAHGTAFDIAGKGIAAPDTYIAAIKKAGEIAVKRGFIH
ncbi:4-hydroxythreonine-4-phosphate dehydrogenase PdxA [bacterium]|nr:4-hydroxythreonine-4-phosphate dehydrogenase PdxA [bacterium]